jgi:DNA-binding NtrC family response regulator
MPGSDDLSTHVLPKLPMLEFASVEVSVTDGPDRGHPPLKLRPGVTRIGTSAGCALRLTDSTVSRVHCELSVEADGVRIVDCESTNGTRVDGVEVLEAKLSSGATVAVGRTKLRVDIGHEPLKVTLSARERFGAVLGSSAAMRRVYALMEMVASNEAIVLLQGETGTGKEIVARAIHDESMRAPGPFVAVDCGALAENLIESELFGHVRGAFTGATIDRRGLFEEAQGGTLFLDEIGELPLSLQPKLLRVLEAREVRPVGANAPRKLDVRVIAATHRSLTNRVNDGSFREDLYYRLAVFEIALPPLRTRREDIPALANHFYERIAGEGKTLPGELYGSLASRSWPGNVRELRNFIERSAAFIAAGVPIPAAPGMRPRSARLDAAEAADGSAAPLRADLPYKEARVGWLSAFERAYTTALLRKVGGNVTRAAEIAGVSRRYMHQLIAQHGISGANESDE